MVHRAFPTVFPFFLDCGELTTVLKTEGNGLGVISEPTYLNCVQVLPLPFAQQQL